MGRERSTHDEMINSYVFLRKRDHSEDPGFDWRILLQKYNIKKTEGRKGDRMCVSSGSG
jgi:hypothetical protein